ncbi:hypothetical protein SBA4_4880009 [Candidatus Sulfopaludibacter sp. SbA4]|nr:hypothetical protein SBA4_4880009 [Candidatus Sulfopaludibacter sp. SbA4]
MRVSCCQAQPDLGQMTASLWQPKQKKRPDSSYQLTPRPEQSVALTKTLPNRFQLHPCSLDSADPNTTVRTTPQAAAKRRLPE